jgi:hypothetical protein
VKVKKKPAGHWLTMTTEEGMRRREKEEGKLKLSNKQRQQR